MSRVLGRDKELIRVVNKESIVLLPDSVFVIEEDTIFGFIDGLDSIFLIVEDTIGLDSIAGRYANESIGRLENNYYSNARTIHSSEIGIEVKNNLKTINQGQFGVQIPGMFMPGKLNEDEPYSEQGWDWLSDLKPKSIRFPGGGASWFVHLYPYRDIDGLPGLDPIKGYGLDIYEIIRYYDVSDDNIDILTTGDYQSIIDDLDVLADGDGDENGLCDQCFTWLDAETYKEDFEGFYSKWEKEQAIPDGPNQSATTQFIHLIDQIEEENDDYEIDVILCLNILSESAPQCRSIVEQLRAADVNVVGVEIGNEVYFDWSTDMMGFNTFNNYWNFINGDDANAFWTAAFYDHVYSDAMKQEFIPGINIGHDYIKAFKGDPEFICKVGLPAENHPNNTEFALKHAPSPPYKLDWNEALRGKNSALYPGASIYCFDAIILHPYFDATQNYQEFIAQNFEQPYFCPDWDYDDFDSRLVSSFKGILGTTPTELYGNFTRFINTRYIESFNEHNAVLKFNPTYAYKKELWTTEWNIKDDANDLNDNGTISDELPRVEAFNESFAHGMVVMEWWLKNLKLNYNPNFAEKFFTYSTFHSYVNTEFAPAMLLDADCGDFRNYGLLPADYTGDRFFQRRTSYYIMDKLSTINKNELLYAPANYTKATLNRNVQPTVFIDPVKEYLYIYFSNVRDVNQCYIVNADDLLPLYFGAYSLALGDPTLYIIDPPQPYSTSGKSQLYDQNDCYTCNNSGTAAGNFHPFDIREENFPAPYIPDPECLSDLNSGETCVTVPAYSLGYIKIPIIPDFLPSKNISKNNTESNLVLFPNPTVNGFKLFINGETNIVNQKLKFQILDITGNVIQSMEVENNQYIDVSKLSAGVYFVKLTTQAQQIFSEKFIKIN